MKKIIFSLFLLFLLPLGLSAQRTKVVILTTNDMHAQIQHFPRLATAVQECRDTVATILVDAGDRWTGNVYVDRAPGRLPIIELMNRVGYDVVTLGNHEFDLGPAVLHQAMAASQFATICANMEGETPHHFVTREGIRIGFAGVVTNHSNGHPVGNEDVYRGLTFTDPVQALVRLQTLADSCAMLVGLAHMDVRYVTQAAAEAPRYDLIAGGHDHRTYIERSGRTFFSETGSNVAALGVCEATFEEGKLVDIDFRLVPLADYAPDPEFEQMVAGYYNNPTLSAVIGHLPAPLDRAGVSDLLVQAIREKARSRVAFYHGGGIRLDSLAAGPVQRADVYNLDPFDSHIAIARMSPAQIRAMIFAHPESTVSSLPFELIRDDRGRVVEVRFPGLKERRRYRVAMGDYMFHNQSGIEYKRGRVRERWFITGALEAHLAE